ncbi:zinc finger BED domain-containing protein 4-like [Ctenocephalides felis]|uniref:zinc finger BED domain-containing protein 4-like n=1 Tax=Ctenocephalides felis TaxID=7515 RepID=UPI000E6E1BA1|nr:zinc finger BED domain-containing protein 4-like [Ctenocephalides felis]
MIDQDLMDMFIDSFHAFSLVEERAFKKLMRWIPGYVLPSRKTVSGSMLEEQYNKAVENTRAEVLAEAQTICITLDVWTSRVTEAYVAVTGHYITDNYNLKTVLLGCCQFEGAHTSENLAIEIQTILDNWKLLQKVNFAISDNANNMKKAIKDILKIKHYGCFAHTINLIVNDGLKLIKSEIDIIKKIVGHFRRSVTACEKLQKYQMQQYGHTKKLIQDVETRWNSTFYMVKRFVEVEESIRMTMSVLDANLPSLTSEMWKMLPQLCLILKPFEDITTTVSGENYLTGSLVIVLVRCLNESCNKLLARNDLLPVIRRITEIFKSGINDRFPNVERSKTFGICTLLDPRFKMKGFSNIEDAKIIKEDLKQKVAKIIEERRLLENVVPMPSTSMEDIDEYNPWTILNNLVGASLHQSTPLCAAIKEIDIYLADDSLPMKSAEGILNCPMQWWRNHQHVYPNLARLFKNQCNVVATSVPCERIFSKAGMVITDRRSRLQNTKAIWNIMSYKNLLS